jgi:hypothetical protein
MGRDLATRTLWQIHVRSSERLLVGAVSGTDGEQSMAPLDRAARRITFPGHARVSSAWALHGRFGRAKGSTRNCGRPREGRVHRAGSPRIRRSSAESDSGVASNSCSGNFRPSIM